MKLLFKAALLLFISSVFIPAQDKNLNLEQVILHGYTLMPKKLAQLNWIPGGDEISYIDTLNGEEKLFRQEYDSNERKEIIGITELSQKLTLISAYKLNRFPKLEWMDKNSIKFEINEILYRYNNKTLLLSRF